ncbi:MAG: carbohydrate kinase family protein, partial [Gammaproteobacteria bacterium]
KKGNAPSRRAQLEYTGCDDRRSDRHRETVWREAVWWQRTEALIPPVPGGGFDAKALTPMPAAYAERTLSAHLHDCPTVLDTSEAFAARDRSLLFELLTEVDLFAPSRAETRRMLPGCDDDAAAIELTSRARTVVQKRGPDGLVLARDGSIVARCEAGPGPVVDPTGAGDAVTGALGVALARGLEPRAMLALADEVARRAVAGVGPSAFGLTYDAARSPEIHPCA